MRVKVIAFMILCLFALNGCGSNKERDAASVNNTANIIKDSAASNNGANDDLPQITSQQYDQIKLGMSKAEVEKIIGAGNPGKSVAGVETTGETYRWQVGGGMLISVTFREGTAKNIAEKF